MEPELASWGPADVATSAGTVRTPAMSMLSQSPAAFKSVSAKPLVLRSSIDKSSERTGALEPGERTPALELARTASGTTRVRTDGGWATAVTNTGKVLMRTCSSAAGRGGDGEAS